MHPDRARTPATSPCCSWYCCATRAEIGAGIGELALQLLLDLAEAIGGAIAAHLRLELGTGFLERLALAGWISSRRMM